MKPLNNETVYELIHSQEMVQFMWRYTLHKQSTQIPSSVAFDEEIDFNILACAVNIEIARNDCLRLRFFKKGNKIKQFFLNEYKLQKIRYKEFASEKEQNDYFDSDASKKLDIFSGETFRLAFFRTHNGKCGIYLLASHIIMDFVATFTFFKDLMAVYESLKNKAELPKPLSKYEDIIKKEQNNEALENKIKRDTEALKNWFAMDRKPVYNAINGPRVLDFQRKLLFDKSLTMPHIYLPIKDKTHFLKCRLNDEDSKKISDFIKENHLSAEWVIQLGFRIYLSKINRHNNDSVFWVLCPRRKTVKEKRCGGTLASPMPWREILDDNKSFIDTARDFGQTQAFLFRLSDVPFTTMRQMERELYGLSLVQTANSMMFSYLPSSENPFGDKDFEYTAYNFGHYVMPAYALTMQDSVSKRYSFSYIHRTWLTTDEEVYSFHNGALRTILKGIECPEKTIGEILEEI